MSATCRIVVVTNGNAFARLILSRLFRENTDSIAGVVFITGDYSGKAGVAALWGTGRKTAFRYLLPKVLVAITDTVVRRISPRLAGWTQRKCVENNIPVMSARHIQESGVLEFIGTANPDVLLSVSCPQRIPSSILEQASFRAINIHSSLLPQYCGLAPYFWVLSRGEAVTGVTVHEMTDVFDEGRVMVQQAVEIREHESAFGLFTRLCVVGRESVCLAVEASVREERGTEQAGSRTYFSHPTREAVRDLRRKGHKIFGAKDLVRIYRALLHLS